jgi:tetratricopeptide (TPR) repeat protein
LLTAAERQLLRARELNPLNTDHSANLGRLNRQWALLLGDPAQRAERARKADEYYRQALLLSPNNAGLWNEWALLAHQLLDDPALAQAKLDQSFALDRNFEQTYQIQGDLYVLQANREADLATKQAYFEQAIAAYQQGIAVTERRGSDALNLYIGLAGAYAAANQPQAAIDAYLRVGQLGAGANQWQVYRAMAELYRQMGDVAQAHTYGQLALDIAPETERDGLQAWLNVLAAPP